MEDLGGLIRRMPLTAVFFLGGALSVSAMVPFNGFISEWLTYQAIFAGIIPGQAAENILFIFAVAALALSGALAAACFIKIFGISFLGLPRSEQASLAQEVPVFMSIGSGALTLLCLVSGVFPLVALGAINQVVMALTKQPIIGQLQGTIFMLSSPLEIHGNTITPQLIALTLVLIAAALVILLRLIFGKQSLRRYGTWDCGYEALTPRMQYSASAFSKPIRVVFKILFKSSRNLKIKGVLTYHPDSMEYTTTTESVFEKYVYEPLSAMVTDFSNKAKFTIQTGSVHTYLLYIFVTVLILMLYNRVSG
jgi:NADH:ubiquinone oxidoreductase subunit 5 (subunit L)/multisubunit Na+/H+ antiporter MnhA subunit